MLAALVTGSISLGSLVGFLAVLGIAARNEIVLISHYRISSATKANIFGPELALRGARERLAPILMTALATALALLPARCSRRRSRATRSCARWRSSILGGLVTSTLLNLFVLPALYLRFGPVRSSSRPDATRASPMLTAHRRSTTAVVHAERQRSDVTTTLHNDDVHNDDTHS